MEVTVDKELIERLRKAYKTFGLNLDITKKVDDLLKKDAEAVEFKIATGPASNN